jgi:hypothetical protein
MNIVPMVRAINDIHRSLIVIMWIVDEIRAIQSLDNVSSFFTYR